MARGVSRYTGDLYRVDHRRSDESYRRDLKSTDIAEGDPPFLLLSITSFQPRGMYSTMSTSVRGSPIACASSRNVSFRRTTRDTAQTVRRAVAEVMPHSLNSKTAGHLTRQESPCLGRDTKLRSLPMDRSSARIICPRAPTRLIQP